jgi:alpha-L-fucosidase
MNRRNFIYCASVASAASALPLSGISARNQEKGATKEAEKGSQRLSVSQLKAWEALGYGMFIHFGISTMDGKENLRGDMPSARYAPPNLDVEQWIQTARDAGMKYAVLTAKHASGHCLWPSKYTDYHVGTSGNKTDVIEAFVKACAKYGIMPGLYYCSEDEHHVMGSETPLHVGWNNLYTTEEYRQFQWNQLEELLTQYGKIGEVWIDIPSALPRDYREKLYKQMARWQPEAILIANAGSEPAILEDRYIQHGWPSDVMTYEMFLPKGVINNWRTMQINPLKPAKTHYRKYYLPVEVCYPIGYSWFHTSNIVRNDKELLKLYSTIRSRGANFLLDVPPDRTGKIPAALVNALMRLKRNALSPL